ncbi:MAG: phosphonate utilization associated putative membrane protein [Marinobacter maritimus]|jgi:phosphonate utilization associated putative membrane protein
MSVAAIILVVISALLHASWNIIGKSNKGSVQAFFFMSTFCSALLLSPYLLWFYFQVGNEDLNTEFWALLLISGLFQILYLLALGFAYKKADVGMVYPMARALPVFLVGGLSFWTGQVLSPLQWSGFTLITLGCLLVPLQRFRELSFNHYLNTGILWAAVAAVGTTGYSMIDNMALSILSDQLHGMHKDQLTSPILSDQLIAIFYLGAQFWATALPLAFYFIVRGQYQLFTEAWRIKKSACMAGLMMGLTYALVLNAMLLTDNVSVVVALRQISIVFGLLMGLYWLKEKLYFTRIMGCGFILCGLLAVI